MKQFTPSELQTMAQFFSDNNASKGLTKQQADAIEQLCNEYHNGYNTLSADTSIVSCQMGTLGCIRIQSIKEVEEITQHEKSAWVNYRPDIDTRILFTDYDQEQPYNRHEGLYGFGASWKDLALIQEFPYYREFVSTLECQHSSSCSLRPFSYNNFWETISFDVVVKNSKVSEFVDKLRKILGK